MIPPFGNQAHARSAHSPAAGVDPQQVHSLLSAFSEDKDY
jgi:hypothetical protein